MHAIRFPWRIPLLVAALAPLLGGAGAPDVRVAGQVHTADGGSPAGVRVVARSGAAVDSVPVDPAGRFALHLPAPPPGERIELRVDGAAGARRYFPALARLDPDSTAGGVGVVLLPLRWSIPAGRFAGDTVEISLRRAFDGACEGCSGFFRPPVGPDVRGRDTPVQSWPATALPLRVAFDRGGPAGDVSPRDSMLFWRAVASLEETLGADLFRPAPLHETDPDRDGAPEDVVLVLLDPTLRAVGWGSSVAQQGDIIYGAVRMRDGGVFASAEGPRLVQHELMHALGFGHTCAWRSAMAEARGCASLRSASLTREDVAYFQLLYRARTLQRDLRATLAVEAALAGERWLGPARREAHLSARP